MLFRYSESKIVALITNSVDSYQMPRAAVSNMGLHCLLITRLVSKKKR